MSDTARFELYAFWRTSATYRVRVAMNLKGLRAEEHNVDLIAGEQRRPEFLAVNPMGAIPALVDREAASPTVLTQSSAILEYLDEISPAVPLLPGDALTRARVRSLAAMLVADTHPLIVPRVVGYITEVGKFDAQAVAAWRTHWLSTGLQAVEKRLASEPETGTYCHGDTITMADICLASIMVILPIFNVEVRDIPTVERIFKACEANEAFARAAPMRQAGAPA